MAKPRATGSHHLLPFDRLSPADFERLCLWLVRREGYTTTRHVGAAGQDLGCDLRAKSKAGDILFQCKRVKRFGPKASERAVRKMLRSAAKSPAKVILLVACNVTDRAEMAAVKAAGTVRCGLWALSELDERVKRHEEILQEFFDFGGIKSAQVDCGASGDVQEILYLCPQLGELVEWQSNLSGSEMLQVLFTEPRFAYITVKNEGNQSIHNLFFEVNLDGKPHSRIGRWYADRTGQFLPLDLEGLDLKVGAERWLVLARTYKDFQSWIRVTPGLPSKFYSNADPSVSRDYIIGSDPIEVSVRFRAQGIDTTISFTLRFDEVGPVLSS